MSNWSYATIQDEGIAKREAERVEREKGCQPLDFTLTPQEHDIARLAMVEILAMQKKAEFGQFTPGLVATELQPSELTEQERESFLRFGGVL